MNDVTRRKRGLSFEESQLVELSLAAQRRRVTFASSQWPCVGCARDGGWGADEKVSIERWYLSLYVEKSLNSKVIKSCVPELRSRKFFLCFGIPMLSICALWTLWTFCIPVWICLFHVFISGYVTLWGAKERHDHWILSKWYVFMNGGGKRRGSWGEPWSANSFKLNCLYNYSESRRKKL